jgi:hypothetical protein
MKICLMNQKLQIRKQIISQISNYKITAATIVVIATH